MSKEEIADKLARAIGDIDFCHFDDFFCFKFGGDGDNGEILKEIIVEVFKRKLVPELTYTGSEPEKKKK